MRLNRWILIISLVVGVSGIWAIQRAVGQYVAVSEAVGKVDVKYVPDSFEWLDPDFERGQAQVRITNRSEWLVTIEYLELHLYFDGEFAGSWYEQWEVVHVSPGESQTVEVIFTVTSNSIQHRGGEAMLSMRGVTKLAYLQIDEPFTIRLRGTIGQISEVKQ